MVNFGPGGFQWLVQAVPLTALVCAATIALILLLVRIVAQSLASQPRRIQESLPSSFMVHSSGPSSPFLARDYDYPQSPFYILYSSTLQSCQRNLTLVTSLKA